MNLGMYLARGARQWGDRPAVLFRDRSLSYRDLELRSNRLAHVLRALGLQRGDRVAVVSPNRPEIVELECALYKAGLVKVALNSRLAPQELADALANAEPVACLAGPEHRGMVDEASAGVSSLRHRIAFDPTPESDKGGWLQYEALLAGVSDAHMHEEMKPDELAVLHYTSGSTGKLKAAMQTVGNRFASLRKNAMGRMNAEPGDVLMLSGPITHASGMFIQPMLYQGATILLMEGFRPAEYLDAIEKHRVTMAFLVPAMIYALLAEPSLKGRDLSSLRLLSYGAAPMSPARIREAWAAFGPVLAQGYGAGETTGGVVGLGIADHAAAIEGGHEALLSACGRPFCESDVQVLDDAGQPVSGDAIGEICVRGPDVFAGYWRAPDQTAQALDANGWLHTGDLARVDDRGYIYIVDRKKEMLVSGGFNIYPSEVESVLAQHPAIYEVCVVGVPDDHWGETVKAVVVLRDGAEADTSQIMDFCRGRLADFKRPRSVDFVPQLPKNANGKLSRKDVREHYWRGRERRVN
ncbi:long-chain fatty acid--CoA ligase [Variovorax sp. Sphag1AA]|uniref:acyl-CoA synthetase n=1 Tax=Variovorax sp. Sphag1AA TaxID=2587027 RepID=UPI00160835ED|nr:long-chain fatty acid--CoA ligase [Variovorax sp. Sphag1AA]MBB3178149.1 acyl-CoA synthetase (AMP-forming)/AMP-acid ligase II [Variovorax sp. Sphag1AA]